MFVYELSDCGFESSCNISDLYSYYQRQNYRSNHRRCSVRKGVLRNFGKFTEKRLCQGLFFNKVAGLRPATLFKKRLWHRCFPVNFVKSLRTPFLQNTSGQLLLKINCIDANINHHSNRYNSFKTGWSLRCHDNR